MIKKDYSYINHLSDINNNTGIKFLHSAASPGSHCPMHMALNIATNIKGVSSLVVGMAECGYYSRYVVTTPKGEHGELHYVYELDSNEVVFGCRKGVTNALLTMSEEGAKVILIILNCIPALIGEDMKSIIEELKEQTDVKIAFIDAAHFKRNGYLSGMSNTLEQLVGLVDNHSNTKQKFVNIFGAARGQEYESLKHLLEMSGYAIQTYSIRTSMEELSHSVNAALSIVYDSKMLKAVKTLQKNCGISYIDMSSRYMSEDIMNGYRDILQILSIPNTDSELIYDRKRKFEENCKELKEKFSGTNFISTYARYDTLYVSEFLCKLGLIPELLHVEEFDEESLNSKNEILTMSFDPYITYITNEDNVYDIFCKDYPQLSLGNCKGMKEEEVISNSTLMKTTVLTGFERGTQLLNEIITQLKKSREVSDGTL